MSILHTVHILPDGVWRDGAALAVKARGAELLTELYHAKMGDYLKFFKMDVLSKLGVLATELLVADEPDRFTPREDRAVLLFSRTGPLSDDRNYQKTISGDDYFPSPALFVYTLANIVTGEIAIRNKYAGDTTAFCLPEFAPEQIVAAVRTAFDDRVTGSAVCGWVEAPDPDHFEAVLALVDRGSGPGAAFTADHFLQIKKNQR